MTEQFRDKSHHNKLTREIEGETEYRISHGENPKEALSQEIQKLRQLDSSHGKLNKFRFFRDLKVLEHDLENKNLLPNLRIITHGRHAGAVVRRHLGHGEHAHASPDSHIQTGSQHQSDAHPQTIPHPQIIPHPQTDLQLRPNSRLQTETQLQTNENHEQSRLKATAVNSERQPDRAAPIAGTIAAPTPDALRQPPPDAIRQPAPPETLTITAPPFPASQDAPHSSAGSSSLHMESLKSAVERAKEGGRPLTITQIGDSHIAFGMETPAIAAKLAADFGLKPDQIRFSSIGDVGKTASYAKDHPGEFMKNIDQNADLVIVSFGSNEATKQEGAQYSHDYGALIDQIKSRDPNGAIAMIGPTDGNFWNTQRHLPGLASVTQSQEGVAAGVSNGAYFEVAPNMGSVASMRSEGLMGSDNLHLTQSGYKKLGGIIADDIANAVINGK